MTDKRTLRAHLRAARRAHAARGPVSIIVSETYLARLAPGTIVAIYAPLPEEADPAPLAAAAGAAGCRLALPHVVDAATPLRFLEIEDDAALAAGPFGLSNPHPHWREVTPNIVLTPLVGFDRRGHRVGQGAGHYDRAFAALPAAWRVGVALSVQEVAALTPDPWDVPLHAIATEKEWIEP